MKAAIFFDPKAYSAGTPSLTGSNVAGESFLRGFLEHSEVGEFCIQVSQAENARIFSDAMHVAGRHEPVRVVDKRCLAQLSKHGVVYHPGPSLSAHAWQRATFGHSAWSLCGITHTTASARAMDAIVELLTAPTQPWDAIICTSSTVKDHILRLFQAQTDYLAHRLGIRRIVLPALPVVPLGTHTRDFIFSEEQRAAARVAVGADSSTQVVLFVGRLAFNAKAHPLAMYQALERAATGLPLGDKVLLVECGWHAGEAIRAACVDAARAACPSIRVITLDGRDAGARETAWACADVFCSLSDNIQESFGLTPIEAMAAGLPVVVSDWNGYKDTVRDGIDGFRIPTLAPGGGLGGDLAVRHALEIDVEDLYFGHVCSLVAVDVEAAEQAFVRLFTSPELRQTMGDAGRKRARECYDWKVIIRQYEALWAELDEVRQVQAMEQTSCAVPWPARMDPFHGFAGYPTLVLGPDIVLELIVPDIEATLAKVAACSHLVMVNFATAIIPSEVEVRTVLLAAAEGPRKASQLVEGIASGRQAFVFRALAWLLKLGVLRVVCPTG